MLCHSADCLADQPFWHGTRPFATCGVFNAETGLDLTGKPCCCEFCGQRDPFDQLCEITTLMCTSVNDCIQRHNGVCNGSVAAAGTGGAFKLPDPFHIFWLSLVVVTTMYVLTSASTLCAIRACTRALEAYCTRFLCTHLVRGLFTMARSRGRGALNERACPCRAPFVVPIVALQYAQEIITAH